MTDERELDETVGGESDEHATDGSVAQAPAWARWLIFAGSALILLLVGATIGLLIGRSEVAGLAEQPNAVDIGFSQDMQVHHQQAVTMGNWARDHSKDPEIRQLGFDISSTQLQQVGDMEGWLLLWDQPLDAAGEYMTWMPSEHHGGGGHSGDAPMPGMATTAELKKLRSLSGKELDVFFLQLMLRHHEGGAPMAEYAAKHAGAGVVRNLAQKMVDSQGAEMITMRDLLHERGAKPLPF